MVRQAIDGEDDSHQVYPKAPRRALRSNAIEKQSSSTGKNSSDYNSINRDDPISAPAVAASPTKRTHTSKDIRIRSRKHLKSAVSKCISINTTDDEGGDDYNFNDKKYYKNTPA
jgi:hypothetical protein